VAHAVREAGERLCRLYALELELGFERFLLSPESAKAWLPPGSPRTGLLVVQEEGEAWVGLYVDPRDLADPGTIVEETSHLVCLSWHASQSRPVSCLVLELQAEVDRYALARLGGSDGLAHFRRFHWVGGMSRSLRARYRVAHHAARRYCRSLQRRFPERADTPGLLAELRGFYRSGAETKLRWAAG
jgi:hypothetical protein